MTRKLKYPVKLGTRLYPAKTEVRVATVAEMQPVFPGIQEKEGSFYIGVWFPDMAHPTVVLSGQLLPI